MKLSNTNINEMLLKYGFYDRERNPDGKGSEHKYNLKKIKGYSLVFDEVMGLMWQQSGSPKEIEFEDAKKWIKELNQNRYAGFKDWRLPTLEEAMSLMEPSNKDGLYIDSLFDENQEWIWTSDLVKGIPRAAWVVGFNGGDCHWDGFYYYNGVRAVRSGQSSQE